MGRSRWPPNSFSEWMVGQNFKSTPRRPSSQTKILNVAVSEDEVSGDETIEITFNGRRLSNRTVRQQPSVESSPARRVRFERDRRPLKSALKKTTSSDSESDTLVDESSEDPDTSEDESSAAEDSDTSEEEAFANRRQKILALKKARAAAICKKRTDSEDSSALGKNLPHPTCNCTECVRGRSIMEAMVQLEAMQEAARKKLQQKPQQKPQQKRTAKGKKDDATSTEDSSTEATSAEATSAETTSAEASATDASEASQTEDTGDEKKNASQKQKNKKSQAKGNDKKPTPKENKKASPKAAETSKAVNKDAFKLPTYPKPMEPNLIMPVRSKVLQCEHTVEGPSDPRPNAFVDSGKGIVRVYHGPTWGNHTAELYGRVNPAKQPSPLPPSARPPPDFHGYPPGPPGPVPPGYYGPPPHGQYPPYPPYPPYPYPGPEPSFHHAGPPSGAPPAKNMFPGTPSGPNVMNAHVPQVTALKEKPSNGMGLAGFAWPETPELIREARAQEQQEKARTEAANNVGPSQGAAPQKGFDFNAWPTGKNGFERTSDKTSKGSRKSVRFGKPDYQGGLPFRRAPDMKDPKPPPGKPVDGFWGAGGTGNTWGAEQGVNNGWGDSGNNVDKFHAAASHHATKPPSDQPAHGQSGDDGGGNGWGNQGAGKGDSQGWGAQGAANDDWNATGHNDNAKKGWGSGSHTVQDWVMSEANDVGGWGNVAEPIVQPSPQRGPDGTIWGGPPGSKPSRPSSNEGKWANTGNTGWGAGNDKNADPRRMPGAWVDNGKPQLRAPSNGSNRPPPDWNRDNNNNQGWNQNNNKNTPPAWGQNNTNHGGNQWQNSGGGSRGPPPDWNRNQGNNGGGHGSHSGSNSRRASPNERYVGAFDWPQGQGPPPGNGRNNGNGGYNNSPAGGWNNGHGGNGGGHNAPRGPPPNQGNNGWNNNNGYNAPRGSPAAGWNNGIGGGGNGGWDAPAPRPQRTPSKNGGGGWGATKEHQSGGGNGWNGYEKKKVSPAQTWNAGGGGGGGGGGGWDNNPSNNAGPTNSSWANQGLAQDTGGKVDNW
ncbi:hypothetical protein VMCG_06647 [Cytospora schulzeri]|uniref:Uncharacterized protein n=1 Tax=Cytospora schulzeri TaxID=448051 RepID=A0A423W6W9_9PEZI|nr:hypothetical protein VMCG_06647 [Valsa malicola]